MVSFGTTDLISRSVGNVIRHENVYGSHQAGPPGALHWRFYNVIGGNTSNNVIGNKVVARKHRKKSKIYKLKNNHTAVNEHGGPTVTTATVRPLTPPPPPRCRYWSSNARAPPPWHRPPADRSRGRTDRRRDAISTALYTSVARSQSINARRPCSSVDCRAPTDS